MAKFSNPSKLSKEEQEKLFFNFCKALNQLKNPIEAAQFLKDLLSVQEVEMLAKRLKVAELLIEGKTYAEISFFLKIGPNTIARVNEWLRISGEGYRMVLERISRNKDTETGKGLLEEKFNPFSWRNIKKKYPLYYWPQLLLEAVVENSKFEEKQKLKAILRTMDKKSDMFKRLNFLLSRENRIK